MGFGFFDKAKQAVDDAAGNIYGEAWLKEVQQEGEWKSLEGWKDQYEPKAKPSEPKEDSEQVKKAKSAATNAAIEMGIKKMHEVIVFELLNALLECASKVLGTTHDIIARDTTTPHYDCVVPLLAALNTVLLSYRFDPTGTGDTIKFKYIRKQACGDLAKIGYKMHQQGKKPSQLIGELQTSFGENQKSSIKAMIQVQVEEFVQGLTVHMDPKGNEKLEQATQALGGKGEDNVLLQFVSFIAVSKLDIIRVELMAILEEFIKSFEDELEVESKSKEDVQANMMGFHDAKYQRAKEAVSEKVALFTDPMKSIMLGCGPGEEVEVKV